MFKAEIKNIRALTSIFDGASKIVDEIQIETDSEGLRARALDRSHISFISFNLGVDFFEEYTITEPETLCVDMDSVVTVLKRSKSNDILTLTSDEANIIFTFTGESKRTFKIKQIDMDYTSPEPPVIDTPITKLPLPFKILNDTVTDLDLITDKMNLKCAGDKLIFKGEGNFSDIETEYITGEYFDGEVDSNYTIEFIKHLLKINRVSDIVQLSFGTDTPILMNLTNTDEDVNVEFLLAPRMEEREE